MKYISLVLSGLLLAMVAGCSSGGDSGRINELTGDVTTLEDELETTKASLAKATEDLETARTQLATATQERNTARTQLMNVQDDLDMTEEDLEDAQTALATANTALSTARSALSTAETQVTTLTTRLETATGQVSSLTTQLGQAETDLQTQAAEAERQLTEAQRIELTARADSYYTVLAGTITPRGMAAGVEVSWDRGESLTVAPGSGAFVRGPGAPSVSGFSGHSFALPVGFVADETAYIYTNIRAPGSRAYWKNNGLQSATADSLPSGTGSYNMTANETTTGGRLEAGGVTGTFTCTGALTDCVVERDSMTNALSFETPSDWMFFSTAAVQEDEAEDYLYFGFWKSFPEAFNGTYGFQSIIGGSDTLTDLTDLSGVARYSGGAVGEYVVRNQQGESDRFGTFAADANLTANFNTTTLGGTISNFRGGGESFTDWTVSLGGGTADAPTASAAFAGGTVGTGDGIADAQFGNARGTGAWTATLYGRRNTRTDMSEEDYPFSRYPVADVAGVVGTFGAASGDIAVAGTFGATP